ncbi:unnamed protein product, partial [Staurois parvus]
GTLAVESGLAQLPPSFLGTSGQFITQVVCAHNRDSSGHGWSVHTAGTVKNMGGRCKQQGQFRTRVVGAHSRDSSKHGWWSVRTTGTVQDTGGSVSTTGTVQDTGSLCAPQGQFWTLMVSGFQTLSGRRFQTG